MGTTLYVPLPMPPPKGERAGGAGDRSGPVPAWALFDLAGCRALTWGVSDPRLPIIRCQADGSPASPRSSAGSAGAPCLWGEASEGGRSPLPSELMTVRVKILAISGVLLLLFAAVLVGSVVMQRQSRAKP